MNSLNSKRFVIQEHHAFKLYWDFRLEMRRILKSWVVPNGIPISPKVKKLAVKAEDHTLDFLQ